MNARFTDARAVYEQWRSRGGEFLTKPKDQGVEIRCYLRDPDGYLIELGQAPESSSRWAGPPPDAAVLPDPRSGKRRSSPHK